MQVTGSIFQHYEWSYSVNSKYERPIVSGPEGDSEVWFNQIPFEIPVPLLILTTIFLNLSYTVLGFGQDI